MKYYAVKIGRQPGVYMNHQEAQEHTRGFSGCDWKSFTNLEAAQQYAGVPAREPSPAQTEVAYAIRPNHAVAPTAAEYVYTDGSFIEKAGKGTAGFAVYFGPSDPRNYMGTLGFNTMSGVNHTNNGAELYAIYKAMQIISLELDAPVQKKWVIHSDSQYALDCLFKWSAAWQENGWLNSSNQAVENRGVIQDMLQLMRFLGSQGMTLEFRKVKGHGGVAGNIEADAMARRAAAAC